MNRESLGRMYYLCDLCAEAKSRKDYFTCWCKNRVVQKKVTFDCERTEDVCTYFKIKEGEQ